MNWLDLYNQYTEDHEAASIFQLWVGISTIASVLERKVWFRLMSDLIYPNMFIILVAPPAGRKGACMSMGSRLLDELAITGDIFLSSEKITPEAIIKRMALCKHEFWLNNVPYNHCSLTAISKELSSVGGRDIEYMFELLCDLYDSHHHKKWASETIGRDADVVIGPWLHLLGGTTPKFFHKQEVQAGIGSGFLSRCMLIWAEEIRFRRTYIRDIPKHERLRKQLIDGLYKIHDIKGEYTWTKDAKERHDIWYENLPKRQNVIEQLAAYHERKQMHLIKLSMILAAAKRQDLLIDLDILNTAFSYLKMAEHFMPRVFSGTGKSINTEDIETVMIQLQRCKKPISYNQLWKQNWNTIRMDHFDEILKAVMRLGAKAEKRGNMTYFWWEDEDDG